MFYDAAAGRVVTCGLLTKGNAGFSDAWMPSR
jgi:hypothetical protein